MLEDRDSRVGTLLNGQRIAGPAVLANGDLLRLGGNILRFNDRGTSKHYGHRSLLSRPRNVPHPRRRSHQPASRHHPRLRALTPPGPGHFPEEP